MELRACHNTRPLNEALSVDKRMLLVWDLAEWILVALNSGVGVERRLRPDER